MVVIEPQSFYKSIEDFNAFIASLGKPIEKIVANYHAGGLASCKAEHIVAVEPMVDFMKSPVAQGMLQHFDNVFGGAMDTRPIEAQHTIHANTTQNWAGVEFSFTKGSSSDFPASSIDIGNKVYYTHFSPNKMHPSPGQRTKIDQPRYPIICRSPKSCLPRLSWSRKCRRNICQYLPTSSHWHKTPEQLSKDTNLT